MRQGWSVLPLCAALALSVAATTWLCCDDASQAWAASRSAVSASAAKRANLRQFTGFVTALDKTSITVEKRGTKGESRTFVRHPEMRTTGELEKEARVTVYYREEDGRAVAHRIVVKPANGGASGRR
jgi:hypothetical protein